MKADEIRVRWHLAKVSRRLHRRPVGHLDAALQQRRSWALAELDDYRKAGVFPRNSYVRTRTPVFEDECGRRCAVAHLVAASGHAEVVARVRGLQNLARVREIGDPAMAEWARDCGLKVDELAEIQPHYSHVDQLGTTILVLLAGGTFASLFLGSVAIIARVAKAVEKALLLSFAFAAAMTAEYIRLESRSPSEALISNTAVLPRYALPLLIAVWVSTVIVAVAWVRNSRSSPRNRHA